MLMQFVESYKKVISLVAHYCVILWIINAAHFGKAYLQYVIQTMLKEECEN